MIQAPIFFVPGYGFAPVAEPTMRGYNPWLWNRFRW
jgi:hypothetical protein